MSSAHILVVDDAPQIRRVMKTTLVAAGYIVSDARSGEEAVARLEQERFDLILLDLNMPGMGGLAACRAMRAASEAAIVVLSVRSSETDKIAALDAGADDYVTKPFSAPELLARIRAALRRVPLAGESGPRLIRLENVEINLDTRRVMREGVEFRLTPKEFDLLQYLVSNADVPIPHSKLLQAVWGPDYGDQVEYLRVFINQLRKKIEADPSQPRYILTEPWVGYRFRLPPGLPLGNP
jgi:two-component system KDP operon response regulator KdpE